VYGRSDIGDRTVRDEPDGLVLYPDHLIVQDFAYETCGRLGVTLERPT
jgi:hypothetical protein